MNFTSSNCTKAENNLKYATGTDGIVATAFPEASAAGAKMLSIKGNAIDAAVAAALAIGVCEPQASGLGGQTMMLISTRKKVIAIDGSSRAPSLAHVRAIYKRDRSTGYRAATVPSTPATLWYVHQRYGTLSWKEVMEPAICIAENGYAITELQHYLQTREMENFSKVDAASGAYYFLKNGQPWPVGEIFKQKDLSNTLKRMSDLGISDFYTGKIARQIDADMRENGGLLRQDDLSLIPWPIQRLPLKGRFRKYTLYTMPPPGAGRTLIFALNMIDTLKPEYRSKEGHEHYRILADIFRKALLERSDRPFDPNFYPQVSEKEMLNRIYARRCVRPILKRVDRSLLPFLVTEDELRGETTHLSVMDKNGIAVSLTQSIERAYGSKAAAGELGFLYNNYIMDYEFNEPEHPFYLRPNAVPWATVAPTILFKGDRIWMAVGSPGSERIISTIAQFLIYIIDENMNLEEAMSSPRLHCSLGGRISLEAERFSEDLLIYLKEHGYRLDQREAYAFYLGAIHAVTRNENNLFEGVAEVRRDGSAIGINE